jgi:hypothetical protein
MSYYLDNKNQSIVAVLAGPPATNQPTFGASYNEFGLKGDIRKEQGFIKLTKVQGALNGVTEATLVAAPDGGTQLAFEVVYLSVHNPDTTFVVLTISHKDLDVTPNNHVLWSGPLGSGERVVQNNVGLWQVYDSDGFIKLVTA